RAGCECQHARRVKSRASIGALTLVLGCAWSLNAVSTLFVRTLSQGLQAFAPVAVAWVWCSRAGDRRSRTLIARAVWIAALITMPGSWWFQRSATRALDEAVLASIALGIAIAGAAVVVRGGGRPRPATSAAPSSGAAIALAAATIVIVVRQ